MQLPPLMVRAVNKPTVESLAAELDAVKRAIAHAFLCPKGVMARYNWSERTFYRRKAARTFPAPRRFPGHGWKLADLITAEQAGHLPCPSAGR